MDTHVVGPQMNGGEPRTASSREREIGVSNHVVKVIEVLAESPHSWEDAAAVALREASRSLRNIASIYVQDLQAIVRDGRVSAWRVNAKVSFVVNDGSRLESDYSTQSKGERTMRYRNRDQGREDGYRPSRDESIPDYDDDGLHGQDRRQYRGRESYEQQTRGGEGGRSGMWDHRYISPDHRQDDQPFRNNADEDRRGYQNIGRSQEFEGGGRGRPDYYLRWRDEDTRDAWQRDRDRWESQGGSRPREDYGRRPGGEDYGRRPGGGDYDRSYGGGYDRPYGGSADHRPYAGSDYNRPSADDYSRTDYGSRGYAGRDFRDYRGPYAPRPAYEDRDRSQGSYESSSLRNPRWQEPAGYDQGRYVSSQYDAQYGQQRRSGKGPKGYKRSDDRIREDVCDRLAHQYDVDATEVEVSVSNGEVTLSGTVSDRDQKFRVEHLADGVGGVHEVHNQLRVRRESGAQASSTQPSTNVQRSAPNPNSNPNRHS